MTTLYDEDEDWRAAEVDDIDIDNVATSKGSAAEDDSEDEDNDKEQ